MPRKISFENQRKRATALRMLYAGYTLTEISRQLQVPEKTASTWARNAGFLRADFEAAAERRRERERTPTEGTIERAGPCYYRGLHFPGRRRAGPTT